MTFTGSISAKIGLPIDATGLNKSKSTTGFLYKILITYSPYSGSHFISCEGGSANSEGGI